MDEDIVAKHIAYVKSMASVLGFEVDPSVLNARRMAFPCVILFGKKRRWKNAFKRYAYQSTLGKLVGDSKAIVAGGGKIFKIQ